MGKRKNEKKQKRERDRPNRRERAVAAQAGQGDEEEAQNDDDWGDWKAQRDEEAQGDDQAQDDEDWGDWKAQREEEAQGDDQAQDDEDWGDDQAQDDEDWGDDEEEGDLVKPYRSIWFDIDDVEDEDPLPGAPSRGMDWEGQGDDEHWQGPGDDEEAWDCDWEDDEEAWGDWSAQQASSFSAAGHSRASSSTAGRAPEAGAPRASSSADAGVAPYCREARGSPADWNRQPYVVVSKRTRRSLAAPPGGSWSVSASTVSNFLTAFLRTRPGQGNESLLERFGPPAAVPGSSWWRVPWGPYEGPDPKKDIRRGWHGCKMEALYSIIYHGKLFASCDESKGHRFFEGKPGVYLHADSRAEKAENYIKYCSLSGDGIFWAAKWEVQYNVEGSLRGRKSTDQLIYREDAVQLSALLLSCHTRETLPTGTHVSVWRSSLECCPWDVA